MALFTPFYRSQTINEMYKESKTWRVWRKKKFSYITLSKFLLQTIINFQSVFCSLAHPNLHFIWILPDLSSAWHSEPQSLHQPSENHILSVLWLWAGSSLHCCLLWHTPGVYPWCPFDYYLDTICQVYHVLAYYWFWLLCTRYVLCHSKALYHLFVIYFALPGWNTGLCVWSLILCGWMNCNLHLLFAQSTSPLIGVIVSNFDKIGSEL